MPSTARPCRAWKRRTAGLDIGIVDVGNAGVGDRGRRPASAAGAARRRSGWRRRAAAGRPSAPPASRRARRCPRNARSPARCARTVAGDSVGSDAFGIGMVREAESKPWPKSPRWVLLDQRLQQRRPGPNAARAPSALPPAAAARVARHAQHGAPIQDRESGRLRHASPRIPVSDTAGQKANPRRSRQGRIRPNQRPATSGKGGGWAIL